MRQVESGYNERIAKDEESATETIGKDVGMLGTGLSVNSEEPSSRLGRSYR